LAELKNIISMDNENASSLNLSWWKILCILLLFFSCITGLIAPVPALPILNETIRNLYFHVPMWFAMTFVLFLAFIFSINYVRKGIANSDTYAVEFTNTGLAFGALGILTGMLWARFTWGTFWTTDPKLNAAAIGMLIYSAYFVLRSSIADDQQRMRVSAVFNIIAFPSFVALVYIMPRLTDSLHPGNGGNPGFNSYDRDRQMNLIFYSANIGFILLGIWITSLRVRIRKIENKINGI
jgi:heme exporter protein C